MSLTQCLRTLANDLAAEDIDAVKALAAQYRTDGMPGLDAGIAAAQDHLADLFTERAELATRIEAKGGVMPKRSDASVAAETPTPPKKAEPVAETKAETPKPAESEVDTETSAPKKEIKKSPARVGTGRSFTGFFANITEGLTGRNTTGKPYTPVINLPESAAEFAKEYVNHRGNFDDHIATSIPGFRELQVMVGSAISQVYGREHSMLDIGASEGAMIKTISKLSGMTTVALDPNPAMAAHFNAGENVPESTYALEAFSLADVAGQTAWTEGDSLTDRDGSTRRNPYAGTEIKNFRPKNKFDVVHEAMVFQFIDNDRAVQIARAKELLTPEGVLILEQKFIAGEGLDRKTFRANEDKKDDFKELYFSKEQIAAKAKAVGVAEKEAFAATLAKDEERTVGMNDLMVAPGTLEAVLSENFNHVVQFWDSGNFKGYLASDSKDAVDTLVDTIGDTSSDFSTAETPREVASAEAIPAPEEKIKFSKKVKTYGATGGDETYIRNADFGKWLDFGPLKTLDDVKKAADQDFKKNRDSAPKFADALPYVEGVLAVQGRVGNEQLEAVRAQYDNDPGRIAEALRTQLLPDHKRAIEAAGTSLQNWYPDSALFKSFVMRMVLSEQSPTQVSTPPALLQDAVSDLHVDWVAGRVSGIPSALAAYKTFAQNHAEAAVKQKHNEITGLEGGEWVELPQGNDQKTFALWQSLSNKNWCTSRGNERTYAPKGPMWVYRKGGQSVLAILFQNGEVDQIQSVNNDGTIPAQYVEEVKNFTAKAKLSARSKQTIATAERSARLLATLKSLAAPGSVIDAKGRQLLKDGSYAIHGAYAFYEKNISDDRVSFVLGDASIREGASAPALQTVGGSANIYAGADVSALQTVGGYASIRGGADVSALQTVGGYARIYAGADVSALQTVGGYASIHEGASVPALQTVGGDASIYAGADVSALQTVGGDASIREGASAPALQTVGGDARIYGGADVSALQTVGGYAVIYEGASVPALQTVGGDASIPPSVATPNLTSVNGKPYQAKLSRVRPSKEPFYSALLDVITTNDSSPKKGTAAQWKGWLSGRQKTGYVKQAELDWLGVDAFLDSRDTTTRAELSDFVKNHQVQVSEELRGPPAKDRTVTDFSPVPSDTFSVRDDEVFPEAESSEDARETYHLTPLEIQGEDRLTWTRANGDAIGPSSRNLSFLRNWATHHFASEESESEFNWSNQKDWAGGTHRPTKYEKYTLRGGQNYRELLLTLPATGDQNFESPHFDTPNILAHVRFSERTLEDGTKALHLEEIQSDWHQAGKEEGYRSAAPPVAAFQAWLAVHRPLEKASPERLRVELLKLQTWRNDPSRPTPSSTVLTWSLSPEANPTNAVPDAPFKKTGEWTMLAFKRMVRWAAENDFDAIVWTGGKQQEDRYKLGLESLDYYYDKYLNTYDVTAFPEKGRPIRVFGQEKDLARSLGKSITRAIVAGEGADQPGGKTISGDQLPASGIATFYDSIIPSEVNRWAKPFNEKVADFRIPDGASDYTEYNLKGLSINSAIRDAALAGLPLFSRTRSSSGKWQNRLDAFRFHTQDKLIDLKRLQESVKVIKDDANAYQRAGKWEGKAEAQLSDFDEDRVQPLLQAIADTGLSLDEVGEWLIARHAQEANAYLYKLRPDKSEPERSQLSGMSNQEAARILSARSSIPQLNRVGLQIDAINRERVALLVKNGLIDRATADAWQGQYKHYVPLKREEAEGAEDLPNRGSMFSLKGRESKNRVGSAYWTPDKIVANTLAQAEASIVRAEKALVGQALLEFAQQNPNPDFWSVDSDRSMSVVRNGQVVQGVKPFDKNHETAVKKDGKEFIISFKTDNPSAMRLVTGLNNLQPAQQNAVFQGMAYVTRMLSNLHTSWNPEFMVSNLPRDLGTAFYNLSSTDIANMKAQIFKDVPSAMNGIRSALFGDGDSEWAKEWEAFRKAGGKTGWIDLHGDIKTKEKKLSATIDRLREGKASKPLLTRFLAGVENANSIIENAVRLSAYKAAKDAKLSDEKAASIAKELTVNFNRKGNMGPTLNAFYMFYNASVQGSVRLLQTLVTSKQGRNLALGTIGFAVMLDLVNRSMSGDDDDGENIYDNLPDYVKDHNIILMGEKEPLLKIPAPWGYNVLHTLGQVMGSAIGNPRFDVTDAAGRVGLSIIDAFNPVGSGSVMQTLAPTLLDPAVQMAENKSFSGTPLKPEHTYDAAMPRPEYLMHFSGAREASKGAAKWLNDISGGNEVTPGGINISPEWLDLLLDSTTGGLGRTVGNTADVTARLLKGEEIPTENIPFARKVTGFDSEDFGVKDRYYDWSLVVAYTEAELKELKGADLAEAQRRPERKLIGVMNTTERNLRGLRKQRQAVLGDKARVEKIDARIREQMAAFNKRYAAIMFPK